MKILFFVFLILSFVFGNIYDIKDNDCVLYEKWHEDDKETIIKKRKQVRILMIVAIILWIITTILWCLLFL